MDKILASMVKSEDIDRLTAKVEGKFKKLEKGQDSLRVQQREMLARIESLERDKVKSNAKANKTEQRLKRLTEDGMAAPRPGQDSDAKAYELARKQLTLHPVSPGMETVKIFLERQMDMDPEAVRSLEIVHLKKLFRRPGAKASPGCHTVVTFGSIHDLSLIHI